MDAKTLQSRVDGLERALQAVYRRQDAGAGAPEADPVQVDAVQVEAVLARVRLASRDLSRQQVRDDRFLLRFLSAAAVAAVMLFSAAYQSGVRPLEVVALNTLVDDPLSATWDQSVDY